MVSVTGSSVVQCSGLREEALLTSGCSSVECSIAPTRGEELNRLCPGCDGSAVLCPATIPDSGHVQVLNGGQDGTEHFLCSSECRESLLLSVAVLLGGCPKPDSDGSAENRPPV